MPEVGPEILAGRGILLVDVEGGGEGQDELHVVLGRVPVKTISSNYTLDLVEDEHAYIVVTAAATITLPPEAPSGWTCAIRHAAGAAQVTIAPGANVTIDSVDDLLSIISGRAVSVTADIGNAYFLDGALT